MFTNFSPVKVGDFRYFSIFPWGTKDWGENAFRDIEIINNTREGIVIFFGENKRGRGDWGANSSPGCRAKR